MDRGSRLLTISHLRDVGDQASAWRLLTSLPPPPPSGHQAPPTEEEDEKKECGERSKEEVKKGEGKREEEEEESQEERENALAEFGTWTDTAIVEDHERSITGYYVREMTAGQAAAERVLTNPLAASWQIRNEGTILEYYLRRNPFAAENTVELFPPTFERDTGWVAMNPSIARLGDRVVVNIRMVNFQVDLEANYTLLPPAPPTITSANPVRTRNFLHFLDLGTMRLDPIGELETDDARWFPRKAGQAVLGFEDVRLFTVGPELWFSANTQEVAGPRRVVMVCGVIGQLNDLLLHQLSPQKMVPPHRVFLPGVQHSASVEKNWLFFEADEGNIVVVQSHDVATRPKRLDPVSGELLMIGNPPDKLPGSPCFKRLRGSANPVELFDPDDTQGDEEKKDKERCFVGVAHDVFDGGPWQATRAKERALAEGKKVVRGRRYDNCFVKYNSKGSVTAVSRRFLLRGHWPIEYTSGILMLPDSVLLLWGEQDKAALATRIPLPEFHALFR